MLNQAFSQRVFLFITYLRVDLKIPGIRTNRVVQNLPLPEFHGVLGWLYDACHLFCLWILNSAPLRLVPRVKEGREEAWNLLSEIALVSLHPSHGLCCLHQGQMAG